MTINNNKINSNFDPVEQLKLLRNKCNQISTQLYKTNALYLEQTRELLPLAIRTSLFSIITELTSNHAGLSSVSSRKTFQLKIDKLVSESISLLTIEHLNELARAIDLENKQKLINSKKNMVNALKKTQISKNLQSPALNVSINLSSLPPLEDLSIIDGWDGEVQSSYSIDDKQFLINNPRNKSETFGEIPKNDEQLISDNEDKFETSSLQENEIDILQSILVLTEDSAESYDVDSDDHGLTPSFKLLENIDNNNRLLPDSPVGLYEWMISLDTALIRRLRDLSHAINVELLRSGLVNTLIPLTLLDSVLSGRIATHKSISNILTFKLPINSGFDGDGLDINCMLITPSDLEFDNPRLRKCRTHIKYQRNLLIGMIKQQRYWEGRSLAEEVRQDWWKNTEEI